MKKQVVLIAAVAALGGLLFGFDTAVIAGTLSSLREYFHLDDAAIGLVVAAASLGCIPGALLAGRLADRYGRKRLMLVTAVLYVVAALGSGMAPGFVALVVYRLIGGVAIGMASTLAPIYISEMAPPAFRGRLGMLQQLAIVVGILLSFVSNYWIAGPGSSWLERAGWVDVHSLWRWMMGAAVIPSVIYFGLLLLVPESPRWLVLRGRLVEAAGIFSRLYPAGEAQQQMEGVRRDIASHQEATLREVLSPRYRRVIVIGLVFAAIAQLTGINIVFYYAPLIFEKTRVGGSVLFQTLLTGIVNLIFTLLAFGLIDRIGRKRLLLVGSWVMGLCMFVIGGLFWAGRLENYAVLVAIFVYIGAFACTWGAVLWVYVAEIFPNKIRGTATSIAVFGNWVANSIVSFTFPVMLSGLGPAATFVVYGVVNLAMVWFVSRYIFETKGIELEKMEAAYANI